MKEKPKQIPIIDIFAGPGGLAEGFSSNSKFKICLSIEKDEIAHKTLELRSFVRHFQRDHFPEEYYKYVRGEISKATLFLKHPEAAQQAREEAWCATLGKISSESLHGRIDKALDGANEWVLIGGPPCQAYSLVGRSRLTGLGRVEQLEDDEEILDAIRDDKLEKFNADHRHTLYKEYLKIVAVHSPSVFVMENVKGILSSKHENKPVFDKILEDLRDPWKAVLSDKKSVTDKYLCGRKPERSPKYRIYSFVKSIKSYEPEKHLEHSDFIIRSEHYGVPQKRHRVILLGVREDCTVMPEAIKPLLKPRTVKEVIGDLPVLRSGISKQEDGEVEWLDCIGDGVRCAKAGKKDADFHAVLDKVEQKIRKITSRGARYINVEEIESVEDELLQWLIDDKLRCVLQHETRGHMKADLWRYVFAAAFAKTYGRSPGLEEFPKKLLPEHKNIYNDDNEVSKEVSFRDRFRVQLANQPATTITSHISKDGHYYIHYDPAQCRSLTVREAARIQTFPDNYFFEGNRTQQYHQIGNAVPPFLALQLADVVHSLMQRWQKLEEKPSKRYASGNG